jgi:hypothetical protein
MKLHCLATICLCAIWSAVTVEAVDEESISSENAVRSRRRLAAPSAFKAYSNNLVLGEKRTETIFEFKLSAAVTDGQTIVVTASAAIWAAASNAECGCLLTAAGAALATAPTIQASSTSAITITSDTTAIPGGSNQVIRVVCSNTNVAANPTSVTAITFTVLGNGITADQLTGQDGWIVGRISMYYLKSECRTGSKVTGALTNCETNAAEASSDCYSPHSNCPNFVVTSGKQEESDGCTPSANTRCDAIGFGYDSVELAFSTNGNYGVATCGAYLSGATIPAGHIRYQTIGTTGNLLISRQSVEVTEGNKKSDNMLTLTGLAPDTQYKVRCHMDDYENVGEDLRVWTDKNLRVWDVSLTPNILTASSAISKMTLSFYHGSTMTGVADATTIIMVTDTAIWSAIAATSCTMYTTPFGGSETQVTQFSASATATTSITFKVLASGISAAGNKMKIECTTNLANNPGAKTVQISSLAVVSKGGTGANGYTHRTVEKVNTYTTV